MYNNNYGKNVNYAIDRLLEDERIERAVELTHGQVYNAETERLVLDGCEKMRVSADNTATVVRAMRGYARRVAAQHKPVAFYQALLASFVALDEAN